MSPVVQRTVSARRLRGWIAPAIAAAALACAPGAANAEHYKYDALGRLTHVIYSNSFMVTYTYDAAGNRTRVVTGEAGSYYPNDPGVPDNPPPQATADMAFVSVNMTTPVDVLTNDTGTGLTVTAVSGATGGSVAIYGGAVYYTAPGYAGPQSFTYTITDSQGRTAIGTVEVDVADLGGGCNPQPGHMCEIDPLG